MFWHEDSLDLDATDSGRRSARQSKRSTLPADLSVLQKHRASDDGPAWWDAFWGTVPVKGRIRCTQESEVEMRCNFTDSTPVGSGDEPQFESFNTGPVLLSGSQPWGPLIAGQGSYPPRTDTNRSRAPARIGGNDHCFVRDLAPRQSSSSALSRPGLTGGAYRASAMVNIPEESASASLEASSVLGDKPQAGESLMTGQLSRDRSRYSPRSRCFPFDFLCCLPTCMRNWFPYNWHVAQDWLHLSLIVSSFSSYFIIVFAVTSVFAAISGPRCGRRCQAGCFQDVLEIIAVIPNLVYFSKLFKNYKEDEALFEIVARRMKQLVDITETNRKLYEDMDELLTNAAHTTASFAEGGFQSTRRDFLRFLERVIEEATSAEGTVLQRSALGLALHSGSPLGGSSEYGSQTSLPNARIAQLDEEMSQLHLTSYRTNAASGSLEFLPQFRHLIEHWLWIFSECSLDPVKQPRILCTREELRQQTTLAGIALLVKERLVAADVRFISAQYQEDQKFCGDLRASFDLGGLSMSMIETTSTYASRPTEVDKNAHMNPGPSGPGVHTMVFAISPVERFQAELEEDSQRRCRCQWCVCSWTGCCMRCCMNCAGCKRRRWPKVCSWCCCELSLISGRHVWLIWGWCLSGAILLYLYGLLMGQWEHREDYVRLYLGVVPLIFYFIGATVVLFYFEDLSHIKRLGREVEVLEEEAQYLRKERTKMVTFWEEVQLLTDIWVNRTLPWLDLMKEAYISLEDVQSPDELHMGLNGLNKELDDFNHNLPSLEEWVEITKSGQLTDGAKKLFQRRLEKIAHTQTLKQKHSKLPSMLACLKALNANFPKLDMGPEMANRRTLFGARSWMPNGI